MSWHVDMIFNLFLAPGGEKSFSPPLLAGELSFFAFICLGRKGFFLSFLSPGGRGLR